MSTASSYYFESRARQVGFWMMAYITSSLLLISLQSFYFPTFGAAILCYLGLLMLVPLAMSRPALSVVVYTVAVIVGGALTSLLAGNGDAELKSAMGMSVSACGLVLTYSAFADRQQTLLQALRLVLWVHAGFLLAQVAYYFLTREYFDVLAFLGIGEQAVFSKKGIELGDVRVPRFAGLFNEPGTYSTLIIPILACEYALSRRVSWLTLVVLASVILTMSLGGIGIAAAFVGVVGAHKSVTVPKWRPIILTLGLAAVGGLGWWFLDNLAFRDEIYVGSSTDHEAMSWVFSTESLTLFGHSLNQIPGYYGVGYFGAWLDLYIANGALALAALIAFLATMSPLSLAVAIVVLLGKLKLTYPLLFVLLAIVKIAQDRRGLPDEQGRLAVASGRRRAAFR